MNCSGASRCLTVVGLRSIWFRGPLSVPARASLGWGTRWENDMANDPAVYRNGEFLPESAARPSVFDLGFQFGDGIYEVVSAWRGVFFKIDAHIRRLLDGLRAARLDPGMDAATWRNAI